MSEVDTRVMYKENLAHINAESTNHHHIRLLRPSNTSLNSGLWIIKIFSLRKTPGFAALSYSWGNHPADASLSISTSDDPEVDRTGLSVSSDLLCAIQNIKRINSLRWLWVDAICINQANNEEKSDQVTMMKTIYAAANRVYVWLGNAIADTDPAEEYDMRGQFLLAGINRGKIKEWILQGAHVWWVRLRTFIASVGRA